MLGSAWLTAGLAGHEPFCHDITGDAGRLAVEPGGHLVALLQIKARRLDLHRVQRDAGAAAPPPLFLGHRQEPAAKPIAAQISGEEKSIHAELAEIAAAIEPAQHLPRNRVGRSEERRVGKEW